MILKRIKWILKRIKWILKRIKSKYYSNISLIEELKKCNHSGGKIIEYIGPSGVGKTILYNLTKNNLSSEWSNLQIGSDNQKDSIDERLFEIQREILKKKNDSVDILKCDINQKLKLMTYFNQVLLNNIRISNCNQKAGFLLEEGICHNFSNELQSLKEKDLEYVMKNRILICVLPHDSLTVVSQIRKRTKEGGHTVYHHEGLDDEELNKLTIDSTNNFINLLSCIQKFNIPVCELSAEDGIELNCKKIIEFEASLFS